MEGFPSGRYQDSQAKDKIQLTRTLIDDKLSRSPQFSNHQNPIIQYHDPEFHCRRKTTFPVNARKYEDHPNNLDPTDVIFLSSGEIVLRDEQTRSRSSDIRDENKHRSIRTDNNIYGKKCDLRGDQNI